MRAVVIPRAGGPEVLEVREVPAPEPGTGEVRVRVRATAINRADLLQRQGRYPAPPGAPRDIPGLEFAGVVEALGTGASLWRPGERVFGLAGGGAHAEYIVAHERALAAIPSTLDWTAAAAVPEAFITAHDALVSQAALRTGERVLIHAAGSGVGLAAVQFVRAAGALPFGTSRTAWKVERARELGLEDGVTLDRDLAGLADRVAAWTSGDGMDVILDLVGGPYVRASVDSLALRGRLMLIATVGGADAGFDLRRALARRITIRGTVLRARALEEKIAATRRFAAEVVPLFERAVLRPVIDTRLPLDAIQDAHRRVESNETFGKVVLTVE
jgi:putative PIG3 family NAD(P)H quinone oxidoreductase